ncbi:MAG: Glu/Leu/Phe/Val dehydrogenase dimerization domain-containing protein [Geminicoccaceae bacterium]
MSVQHHPAFDQHDEVTFFHDQASGLRAIVALHRSWDKPSVGGCRVRDYHTEDEALLDVLRLSRGMTYKSVMAGLAFGGAKAVIIGVPDEGRRRSVMRAMARIVHRFGGRFRTGVDLGLRPADIDVMQAETPFVFGNNALPPSNATAQGLLVSIKAAVRHKLARPTLRGVPVAVQGLGKVGMRLAILLVQNGARVVVGDVDSDRVQHARQELGVGVADAERVHAADVDVFCPCALGGILNDHTIEEIQASVIVGAANNQLAELRHGEVLHQRGVLYAPDYMVNAGGLIAVAGELENHPTGWIEGKIEGLAETLDSMFVAAGRQGVSTNMAADRLAEQRIGEIEASLKTAA